MNCFSFIINSKNRNKSGEDVFGVEKNRTQLCYSFVALLLDDIK